LRETVSAATILPAIAVALVLMPIAGAGSTRTFGPTACAVSFTARHGNLDCVFRFENLQLGLRGTGLTVVASPNGAKVGVDVFGGIVSVSPEAGGRSTYRYDGVGRLVRAVGPRGDVTEFDYDDAGRIVRIVAGEATEYTYDDGGRIAGTVDPTTGQTTSYSYDEAGRPVHIRVPDGDVTFTYDHGRLVATGGATKGKTTGK